MTEKKRPLYSILHTSARPDVCLKIFDAWMAAAHRPQDVEYILVVDERWGFKQSEHFAEEFNKRQQNSQINGFQLRVYWNEGRRCYVDGVNTAAKASTGQILIVNADDQYPMLNWDSALWQVYLSNRKAHAGDSNIPEVVIEVSTGTPDEHDRGGNPIIVMPVVSRARYERLGYLFYPDYESMFADNDLHDHAAQDGVIVQAHGLMFPHRHAMFDEQGKWREKGTVQLDEAYRVQNRELAYKIGHILLTWRRRIRFGDALQEAKRIEGWMYDSELAWLSRTASQQQTVVEIGSWKGKSTYAICSGTAGEVYAVDHWAWKQVHEDAEGNRQYQRTGQDETSDDVYKDFVSNIVDKFPNVLAIRKTGLEAAKTLPDADMVFIDDSHEYEEFKANLLTWLPKAKRIICGHDYSQDPGHAGVVKAVNEVFGARVRVAPGTTIWFVDLTGEAADIAGVPAGSALSGTAIIPNGKVIAWCLPGETFQGPIVSAILRLYGYLLSRGYYVIMHQAWTSSPYVTREAIRLSVLEMSIKPHYVLWTDDDNPVTPEIFERLLKDLEAGDEISMVAGWTWVDMYNGNFAVSAGIFSEDKTDIHVIPPKQINSETKLIEVEWTGFPVVLMKHDALVSAGDKPFAGIPAPNSRWGMTGEDTAFCTNLKARSSCRIFVDPVAFVPHLKFGSIGPAGRNDVGATVEEMEKI